MPPSLGQVWYTQNRNNSNEPGRPITITFFNSTNLVVDYLTIIQPQFWATFVSHSSNVIMTNVFVNATSDDEWGTVNTDGTDTCMKLLLPEYYQSLLTASREL